MKHIAIAILLSSPAVRARRDAEPVETPNLTGDVAAGKSRVPDRVPSEAAISDKPVGQPGGELHILMSGAQDTRLMVVYGYARLSAYTPESLAPDIAKSVDMEDDRSFTFHCGGHKMVDGAPFTL